MLCGGLLTFGEGGLGDRTGAPWGSLSWPHVSFSPLGGGVGSVGTDCTPQPLSLWGVRAGGSKGPAACKECRVTICQPRHRAFPVAPPWGSRKSRMIWRPLTVPKLLACLTRFPAFLALGKRSSHHDAGLLPNPSPRCHPQLPAVGCSISAPVPCQPFLICFLFYRNLSHLLWLAESALSYFPRRTGAILSLEVLLDDHKGQGHTNSLSHRTSIKSSPETEKTAGQITKLTGCTVCRKRAGWEVWEGSELVWSRSPPGIHCIFLTKAPLTLPALWEGAREQGVGGMLETASRVMDWCHV